MPRFFFVWSFFGGIKLTSDFSGHLHEVRGWAHCWYCQILIPVNCMLGTTQRSCVFAHEDRPSSVGVMRGSVARWYQLSFSMAEVGATTKYHHTMQLTTTHCNTLQHITTHCNTLQHTATHCNTLQHTATHCISFASKSWMHIHLYIHLYARGVLPQDCSVFQCVAVCCSVLLCCAVLHCVALCCSVSQCVAIFAYHLRASPGRT